MGLLELRYAKEEIKDKEEWKSFMDNMNGNMNVKCILITLIERNTYAVYSDFVASAATERLGETPSVKACFKSPLIKKSELFNVNLHKIHPIDIFQEKFVVIHQFTSYNEIITVITHHDTVENLTTTYILLYFYEKTQ